MISEEYWVVTNCRAFITGVSKGIGLELVRAYLSEGWFVFACYHTLSEEIILIAKEYEKQVKLIYQDLSDLNSLSNISKCISGSPIDILINNAAFSSSQDQVLDDIVADTAVKIFSVNTIAPLLIIKELMPNLMIGLKRLR